MTKSEKAAAAALLERRAGLERKLNEINGRLIEAESRRDLALKTLGRAVAGLEGDAAKARAAASKIEAELTELQAAKSALESELARLLPALEAAAGELSDATHAHRAAALERLQADYAAAAEAFGVAERRVSAGLVALGMEAPETLELNGPAGPVTVSLDWSQDPAARRLHSELSAPLELAHLVERALADERARAAWRRGELGRRGRGRASFDDVADHPWWVVRDMQVSLNDGTILKPGERFHREQVQGPRRLRLLYESRRAAPFYEDEPGPKGEAA